MCIAQIGQKALAVERTAWVPRGAVVDGAQKLSCGVHHVQVSCGAVGVPKASVLPLEARKARWENFDLLLFASPDRM